VICSACGFDNPAGMRFCGMCGIPLPLRPLTTPGAQSTLSFTRVPRDSAGAFPEQNPGPTNKVASGVLEKTPKPQRPPVPDVPEPARHEAPAAIEPPAKELVPDMPFDEYVKKFRYEPPKDPAEVTMRGESQVELPEPPLKPAADAPKITATAPASNVNAPVPSNSKTPVADTKDVDSRLGLEPESPAEANVARPRFLDINDPQKKSGPDDSGTATIAGPSFLGLSNSPQNWAQAVGVEEGEYAPRNSHWRAWLAIAVLLVIAGLGFLEWRAQRDQTNNGPVEFIRAKIHDLRQGSQQNGSQAASPVTPPAGADSKANPQMQVQEQPGNPQPQQQATTSPSTNGAADASPAATAQATASNSAGNASPSSNGQSAPAGAGAASQNQPSEQAAAPAPSRQKQASPDSSQSVTSLTPATPKAKRQVGAGEGEQATAQSGVAGAEEMTKAKNASDSAAAAAWLWKATAKGNPDAPVQLADMYIAGDGVPHSCEQALVLLKTAAEKENARARNRLASLYSTGTCVQRNRVEAYRWLSSALTADPNNPWAQQNRDLLWQQMGPEERASAAKYR